MSTADKLRTINKCSRTFTTDIIFIPLTYSIMALKVLLEYFRAISGRRVYGLHILDGTWELFTALMDAISNLEHFSGIYKKRYRCLSMRTFHIQLCTSFPMQINPPPSVFLICCSSETLMDERASLSGEIKSVLDKATAYYRITVTLVHV